MIVHVHAPAPPTPVYAVVVNGADETFGEVYRTVPDGSFRVITIYVDVPGNDNEEIVSDSGVDELGATVPAGSVTGVPLYPSPPWGPKHV